MGIKEINEMTEEEKDKVMECVKCVNNPETCGATDADRDGEGRCTKREIQDIWKEQE